MKKLPPVPRNVLVTGCSTGIGRATAVLLKKHGWRVFPTARRASDLDVLRTAGFEPIEMDMADADSVAAGAEIFLKATAGRPGALVNNAGFGQPGALEDLSREAVRYQFEVNVIGLHDITHRLAPVFRSQGAGRIVNISSVVGWMALPFLGAYSASKFAVEGLTDALRVEMSGSGVGVSLVNPGPIITEFRHNAVSKAGEHVNADDSSFGELYMNELVERRDRQKKAYDPFSKPPEAVGAKILHALESGHPRRHYPVTLPAYLVAFLRRFAPTALTDALLARQVRVRNQPSPPPA